MENMAKACLCRLYYGYFKGLLEKTVRLEVEMPGYNGPKICLTEALSLVSGMRTAS
mgnify:CR=1 FL=1